MIRIWIGRRESDVLTYKPLYFDYSITLYGSNNLINNFSFIIENRFNSDYSTEFIEFVKNKIEYILSKENDDFELYFYSSYSKEKLINTYQEFTIHCKNCNEISIIDWLDNKTYTRLWLSNTVDTPEFKLLSKEECRYDTLINTFKEKNEFVLQINYSDGGEGTYKLNHKNIETYNSLSNTNPYLVSPYYYPSISACCHVIIGNNETVIFPIGEQIISNYNDHLSYSGTRYDLDKRISNEEKEKCYFFIEKISDKLRKIGYRGICGYDFLIYKNTPMFIEINPRYMGSSYLINYILSINNLPSLFELNTIAFSEKSLKKYKTIISKLEINYITYTFHNDSTRTIEKPDIPCTNNLFIDGLNNSKIIEPGALLYRYFKKIY